MRWMRKESEAVWVALEKHVMKSGGCMQVIKFPMGSGSWCKKRSHFHYQYDISKVAF
jgi:hypothetical protein